MSEVINNAYQIETTFLGENEIRKILEIGSRFGVKVWIDGMFVVYKTDSEKSGLFMSTVRNNEIYVQSALRRREKLEEDKSISPEQA